MNTKNLRAIAKLCREIPQSKFGMAKYRQYDDQASAECGSVGCVLGHATRLETGKLPRDLGGIRFTPWSEVFTGLDRWSREWGWCFASSWDRVDNTPTGAAARIEWMLAGNPIPEIDLMFTAEAVAMYS